MLVLIAQLVAGVGARQVAVELRVYRGGSVFKGAVEARDWWGELGREIDRERVIRIRYERGLLPMELILLPTWVRWRRVACWSTVGVMSM